MSAACLTCTYLPVARRDGDVYPHYFEMVKSAPGAIGVAPYYESTIKPMLEGADLQAMASQWEKAQSSQGHGDDSSDE